MMTHSSIIIFFLYIGGGISRSVQHGNGSSVMMLPARLSLVLKGFLGVVGGAGGVLHGTLHMRVNPESRSQCLEV
jgi:hypothetical protein